MQSKNVLWLGLLLLLLLTVYCITKYINKFHPDIQTITTPASEIIDKKYELKPVEIADISIDTQEDKVDENYLRVIQLVEQEEKDIKDAYEKALLMEEKKTVIREKLIKRKIIPLEYKVNPKSYIETILANQTIVSFGKLSYLDKQKLKKIVKDFQKNPSTYLRIEADKKNNKFYNTKRYLAKLGVSAKDIQVIYKKSTSVISISDTNHGEIEILVIKKD